MRSPSQRQQNLQRYFSRPDSNPLFLQARKASEELGKEGISMSDLEAQIVGFFIKNLRCEKFVEIGTLTGFSALHWLEALPQTGRLWTFEKDPVHAEIARKIFSQHPRKNHVQLCEGDALVELEKIKTQGPFDGIFIDGNKAAYGKYLDWGLENIRPGGLFALDNVLLGGAVLGEEDSRFSAKQIEVMNSVNQRLRDQGLFESVFVPTDEGLFLAIKK